MNNPIHYDETWPEVEVASTSDLLPGERLFVEINHKPIVLFNLDGRIYAIGDICTHDNGPLGDGEIEGNEVICPRHGARFDFNTGKAKGLPAVVDIPIYPVRVENDKIWLRIPPD